MSRLASIRRRHGLFSSGGAGGEDVLEGIIRLAPQVLSAAGGFVGVVSEFMDPSPELCTRMLRWWEEGRGGGHGLRPNRA